MVRDQWSGGEWQDYCRALLGAKYGSDIQFIPDRDKGDGGLEAYRFDGVGYQCYAPQNSYSTATQTEAQKAKIAQDIGKLCTNLTGTKKLLGDVVLHQWVLLTPEFDSRKLVEYARTKSETTRKHPRPFWCHEKFEIVICTDEIFATERAALLGQLAGGIYLDLPSPEADALFAATSGEVADRVHTKLLVEPTLAANPERLGNYKSSILIDWVRGKQQIELLANDYASVHVIVQRRLATTLRGLAREFVGTPGDGPVVIETLTRRLAESLQTDAPGLSSILCEELARYAVALWFVDCPLYFAATA